MIERGQDYLRGAVLADDEADCRLTIAGACYGPDRRTGRSCRWPACRELIARRDV